MRDKKQFVIFSDLDGTLLDSESYSPRAARDALKAVKKERVPLIFCSSKTRKEVEFIRRDLEIRDPFIVENGGAVFIPRGYFPFDIDNGRIKDDYIVIELGQPYSRIVDTMKLLKAQFPGTIVGFNDLTVPEIAMECGFSLSEAQRAKAREYDEPFKIIHGQSSDGNLLFGKIIQRGLNFTSGGKYWHLHGLSDKGRAVRILISLFERLFGRIVSAGLGDSMNDVPMLEEVDIAVLMMKPDMSFDKDVLVKVPDIRLAPEPGPAGWNIVILYLIKEQCGSALERV